MKLSISIFVALMAASAAQAATPTQYSETYDAEGNRTWTKYAVETPQPIYSPGAAPTGSSTNSLLAFPIVGLDAPTRPTATSAPGGYASETGTSTEMLNNKYPDNH